MKQDKQVQTDSQELKNKNRIFFSLKSGSLRKRDLLLVAYDLVAVSLAYFFALWFRFDCQYTEIPDNYFSAWLMFTPAYALVCVVVFRLFHLYQSIWKFASFVELKRIIYASALLAAIHAGAITLVFYRMPISYYVIGAGFQFLLITGVRFSYRFLLCDRNSKQCADPPLR